MKLNYYHIFILKHYYVILFLMHDWFVGCFTTYLQELGELASRYDICLHVDLCLGGFVLPFARKLGYEISS